MHFLRFFHDTSKELGKNGQFFKVAIHSHPGHPQSKITNTSFCALVKYLLTTLGHYLYVFIDTNMLFQPHYTADIIRYAFRPDTNSISKHINNEASTIIQYKYSQNP